MNKLSLKHIGARAYNFTATSVQRAYSFTATLPKALQICKFAHQIEASLPRNHFIIEEVGKNSHKILKLNLPENPAELEIEVNDQFIKSFPDLVSGLKKHKISKIIFVCTTSRLMPIFEFERQVLIKRAIKIGIRNLVAKRFYKTKEILTRNHRLKCHINLLLDNKGLAKIQISIINDAKEAKRGPLSWKIAPETPRRFLR